MNAAPRATAEIAADLDATYKAVDTALRAYSRECNANDAQAKGRAEPHRAEANRLSARARKLTAELMASLR